MARIENGLRQQPDLLKILLMDCTRTTPQKVHNISWATDLYVGHAHEDEIQLDDLVQANESLIQPRVTKSKLMQRARTQDYAEVYTPSGVVKQVNQQVDKQSGLWPVNETNWQSYVKDLRLEITCGEAPFMVNRYDVASGEKIEDLSKRAGFLDFKLQVVSRYCNSQNAWLEWALQAFKAAYGYEWQGDSLFLARENLLYTFVEYWNHQFPGDEIDLTKKLSAEQLKYLQKVAKIIAWNVWQMDGLSYTLPLSCTKNAAVAQNITLGNMTVFMQKLWIGKSKRRDDLWNCWATNIYIYIYIYIIYEQKWSLEPGLNR